MAVIVGVTGGERGLLPGAFWAVLRMLRNANIACFGRCGGYFVQCAKDRDLGCQMAIVDIGRSNVRNAEIASKGVLGGNNRDFFSGIFLRGK